MPTGLFDQDVGAYKAIEIWSGVDDAVAAMWLAIEELQSAMAPLIQAYEATQEDDDFDLFGDAEDPKPEAESVSETADEPAAGLDEVSERIAETVWAMSFVVSGELKEFRNRLPALLKLPDAWELVDAMQGHLKHLRSALNAILAGIFGSLAGSGGDASDDDEGFDLMAAREVRSRVFELRDEIGAIEAALRERPPGEWLDLLKQAQALLDQFVFGPGFAWTRAVDKRSFLGQRKGLQGILQLWSPLRAEPARRSVEGLARFLDALEVINQREVLVVHDRAALTTVRESLQRAAELDGPEARQAVAAGLAALSDASGRDRELDALLASAMAPGSDVPVEAILERTQRVLGQLGG